MSIEATVEREAMTGALRGGRVALRVRDLPEVLGVSAKTIERLRRRGELPEPDRRIGALALWSPATIARWVEDGGRS